MTARLLAKSDSTFLFFVVDSFFNLAFFQPFGYIAFLSSFFISYLVYWGLWLIESTGAITVQSLSLIMWLVSSWPELHKRVVMVIIVIRFQLKW